MIRFFHPPHIPKNPKQKSHTLLPAKDMALILVCVATPYAGIIQVRFKGYTLSHIRHPCSKIYYISSQNANCLIDLSTLSYFSPL